MPETPTSAKSSHGALIAALWCAGGLFDGCQTVLFMHALGREHAWLVFTTELVSWLPWMWATPIVIRLARSNSIFPGLNPRAVGVHLLCFGVVSLGANAWFAALQAMFNPWQYNQAPSFAEAWRSSLMFQFPTYLVVYALILGFTTWMDARERRAREVTERARLSEELSKSQLRALRQQIEPHFMFNTLHSITGLVRDHDNEAAVNMIVGLSEFLRRGLQDSHRPQVSLAEETEYLQRYLELQTLRFGERLQVSMHIPPELLGALVPGLLLQPLVENAIKHGIARRAAGGLVRISAAAENDELRLSVYNDAPDSPIDWQSPKEGVGLSNLRARLRILHADAGQLDLGPKGPDGVEVIVRLPFEK